MLVALPVEANSLYVQDFAILPLAHRLDVERQTVTAAPVAVASRCRLTVATNRALRVLRVIVGVPLVVTFRQSYHAGYSSDYNSINRHSGLTH